MYQNVADLYKSIESTIFTPPTALLIAGALVLRMLKLFFKCFMSDDFKSHFRNWDILINF